MIAGAFDAIDQWLRRREVVEEVTEAYFAWWQECTAVRDAYRTWLGAARADAAPAFAGYALALEREQRAAEAYAAQASRHRELVGR
ncbi:MAG: hypothetical protein QOC64_2475 [Solirubrobacteraceae bacterium]|jgi:hypothetical protein|nr:hypothetical protein [Solirubrobacteraceae bacterium]